MQKLILVVGMAVAAGLVPARITQVTAHKETQMHHAVGTFDVKMKPEPLSDVAGKTNLGRMSIDKVFYGQLEGTSQGEFLSAMGSEKGSAGYVAIERVTGTLDGKAGSFVLMHRGLMTRGAPELLVTVVPDSGTEQLVGLKGTFKIDIVEGKHNYEFDYSL
jgi:hypothetical protein